MAKNKYYVVWSGRKTGIFTSWEQCKKQVIGISGAQYKAYPTKQLAEEAYTNGSPLSTADQRSFIKDNPKYRKDSISVDAACSGNPGFMEYRGVYTKNGEEIFHYGPVDNGTNNIGEFLAIVHALALLKQKNSTLPIYSDSMTAISWVRNKRVNTTVKRNKSTEKVWNLIDRAILWLNNNSYENELLKWETENWGEIKADFGRK